MITIVSDQDKELDQNDVQALSTLWSKPFQNLDAFFNSDENEEHDFYTLSFASLTDRSIDIDWKWEPSDIFWQLKELLPECQIELTSEIYKDPTGGNKKGDYYKITFAFNGKEHALDIPWDDPDVLLNYINTLIAPRQFIAIDFLEDRYSWMLVPANFDMSTFCEVTGMQQDQEVSEKQSAIPSNAKVNITGKQSKSIPTGFVHITADIYRVLQ